MQLDMPDAGLPASTTAEVRRDTQNGIYLIRNNNGAALPRTLRRRLNGSNLNGKTAKFDFGARFYGAEIPHCQPGALGVHRPNGK